MNEGQDRIKASYKHNYDRLRKIKTKYDPNNFFRVNQNILPEGAHSYEIVLPASVPDRVRAGHVFDAVANEVRQRYVCARAARIEDDEETETSGSG